MNFPVVFHVYGVSIRAHLVFELAAYMISFQCYRWYRHTSPDRLDSDQRLLIFLGAILGAALVSKFIALLEHPEYLGSSKALLFYWFANKSIVGGLIGGLIGVELAKKYEGITHSTGDAFYWPLIVGIMIGRIGCFLSGVEDSTHGVATESFLGMDLGDGVPRHPTALYEIVVLLLISLGISWASRRVALKEGAKFKIFMLAYFLWRFGIEFLKPVSLLPYLQISAIQLASLCMILYYWRAWLTPRSLLKGT